jgi:hypothetical protein
MYQLQQEQAIESWLTGHKLPLNCPACGSDQRRMDLNPPSWSNSRAADGDSRRYKPVGVALARVEITCLRCASVRVFDAATTGLN